ncbi:MAG TPA: XRE family transcriptional regulator [Bacillota bacterium]|jgi:Zn-dependent peptidase ImmA (M78 family)/transcriptional regulator with XRE-family HTH domain
MPVGDRIRMARKASDLSLRDLAARSRLSAQAISKYERGLNRPSSAALLRLSVALEVRPEYFYRPESRKLSIAAHRCIPDLSPKAQGVVLEKSREALERLIDIENLLPGSQPAESLPGSLPEHRAEVRSVNEIEDAASALRRKCGLGSGPIANLTSTLEDFGLRVLLIEGPPGFDACILQSQEARPVISVNSNLPGDRQRFSMAHELGHLVLKPVGDCEEEAVCHRYAGAFLAPQERVVAELGQKRMSLSLCELEMLKAKYGLSMQAWIHRAEEVGVITRSLASALLNQFRKNSWKITEPGRQVPPETAWRAQLLVSRAVDMDLITRSRAAELLGKPLAEMGRLWKLPHR